MTKHLLYGSQIGTPFYKVCSERMPERMRNGSLDLPDLPGLHSLFARSGAGQALHFLFVHLDFPRLLHLLTEIVDEHSE